MQVMTDHKRFIMRIVVTSTPPKFNSLPLKSYHPNRKVVFQPPFFSGYVKLQGGTALFDDLKTSQMVCNDIFIFPDGRD